MSDGCSRRGARAAGALGTPVPTHPLVHRKSVKPLEVLEPAIQRLLIGGGHSFAPRVVPLVSFGELGELAGEDGKEAVPRRGAEPERRPYHVAGARLLRLFHESREACSAVGDTGENGSHQQSGAHAAIREATKRPEPCRRHGRAQLEPPREPGVGGGE